MLYDGHSIFRKTREYKKISALFPEIYAWVVDNASITDECIVHRGKELFVDSSIHSAASRGRENEQIADRFIAALSVSDLAPNYDYSDLDVLVLHNEGDGTWGHFVVQNFPKVFKFFQLFPEGKIGLPVPHTQPEHSNFARLFEIFGIDASKLIPLERRKTYKFRKVILVDFMYSFSDQIAHPESIKILGAAPIEIGVERSDDDTRP